MALNPTWVDSLSYAGLDLRRVDALLSTTNGNGLGALSGIRPGGGLTTTLSGSTISVSVGVAYIYYANQGMYRASLSSTWSGTLSAADSTNTRIDLVYLRVWDNSVDASGLNKTDVVYLPGTPSATPAAPTPAGTQIYIPLANITVPPTGGGSPSVSTSVRPTTVAPGGILPSQTSTPAGAYTGMYWDDGTNLVRYNGSGTDTFQKVTTTAWTQPGLSVGFTHNGNNNGNVQYRKVTIEGTPFMQWRGGLGITYVSNAIQSSGNFLAFALPAGFRPPNLTTTVVACSAATSSSLNLKVDFAADGTTSVVGTTTNTSDSYSTPIIRPPWLSLNGVQYPLV